MSTPRLLSKTGTGVMQETWAMLLGHYALRAWMMQAASHAPVLDADRLSVTQALCVLGTALTLSLPLAQARTQDWQTRLLQDLRSPDRLLPARRLRCYPRVVKLASTRFFVKQATHVPFVLAHTSKTWKDFLLPLHTAEQQTPILLI